MNKKALVVDTNIIFSALIPDQSRIRDLFFESDILFYAPNYLIFEIYAHKEKLLKNSKLNEQEFYIISKQSSGVYSVRSNCFNRSNLKEKSIHALQRHR